MATAKWEECEGRKQGQQAGLHMKEGREETGGTRDNEEFSSSFSSLEKLGFDITEKLFQLPNPSGTNQQEPPEQTTKEAGHSTPVKKVSQPQTPAKVSQLQTPAPVSKGARKPGAMFGEDYFMKLLQASPERPPAASARGDKNNEDGDHIPTNTLTPAEHANADGHAR